MERGVAAAFKVFFRSLFFCLDAFDEGDDDNIHGDMRAVQWRDAVG